MSPFRAAAFLAVALVLAACGGMRDGNTGMTDSSGSPIKIGVEHHNASTGPGKPGWPEPENTQRAH